MFFFFKQKTAYEMRISDWSSDVCSSDLRINFLAATDEPAQEIDMRVYAADLTADLHDIRGHKDSHAHLYDPDNYAHSQGLAAELREAGSDGIRYRSVRHEGGECAAAFRPRLLANCRQERHLCYVWDGETIGTVYEKKNFERSEEHTSELQSLKRNSYAVFCLKKK